MGVDIAVDLDGNAYITGETDYPISDFPTTSGAYDTNSDVYYKGFSDVFYSKISPDGSQLLYSTYIGGDSYDIGTSIALDANKNVYIAGHTNSTTDAYPWFIPFPTTAGAYDRTYDSHWAEEGFIVKFNENGQLLYSTLLGSHVDTTSFFAVGVNDIAVDKNGNAAVVGTTNSPYFPTTAGAYIESVTVRQQYLYICCKNQFNRQSINILDISRDSPYKFC